jgi:hypothetical protein
LVSCGFVFYTALLRLISNMPVDTAPFGRSDLAHKAARGLSPLRWAA